MTFFISRPSNQLEEHAPPYNSSESESGVALLAQLLVVISTDLFTFRPVSVFLYLGSLSDPSIRLPEIERTTFK